MEKLNNGFEVLKCFFKMAQIFSWILWKGVVWSHMLLLFFFFPLFIRAFVAAVLLIYDVDNAAAFHIWFIFNVSVNDFYEIFILKITNIKQTFSFLIVALTAFLISDINTVLMNIVCNCCWIVWSFGWSVVVVMVFLKLLYVQENDGLMTAE